MLWELLPGFSEGAELSIPEKRTVVFIYLDDPKAVIFL